MKILNECEWPASIITEFWAQSNLSKSSISMDTRFFINYQIMQKMKLKFLSKTISCRGTPWEIKMDCYHWENK